MPGYWCGFCCNLGGHSYLIVRGEFWIVRTAYCKTFAKDECEVKFSDLLEGHSYLTARGDVFLELLQTEYCKLYLKEAFIDQD